MFKGYHGSVLSSIPNGTQGTTPDTEDDEIMCKVSDLPLYYHSHPLPFFLQCNHLHMYSPSVLEGRFDTEIEDCTCHTPCVMPTSLFLRLEDVGLVS